MPVKADPLVGEPRYRLAEAYLGAGRGDSALAMLQTSLSLGYVGAPETYLSVGKRLEFSGRSTSPQNSIRTTWRRSTPKPSGIAPRLSNGRSQPLTSPLRLISHFFTCGRV